MISMYWKRNVRNYLICLGIYVIANGMKQDFQEKGKYMKVKEFLENFTGDNHIKIYDMHSFDTHRYNNANEAIRQFGYYTVREWKIIDNVLKITIRTQF